MRGWRGCRGWKPSAGRGSVGACGRPPAGASPGGCAGRCPSRITQETPATVSPMPRSARPERVSPSTSQPRSAVKGGARAIMTLDRRAPRWIGAEQAEVAESEAEEPGDAENPPGLGRGVGGERRAADHRAEGDEEDGGDRQAQDVDRERTDPPRRRVEGDRRRHPAAGGAQSGELTGVGDRHGGEAYSKKGGGTRGGTLSQIRDVFALGLKGRHS